VAKVKVINPNLDQNLNGTNFDDFPSKTIFSFGSFYVTSNFDGKETIDFTNTLSSFVRPVTLDTMNVSNVQSQILDNYSTNAVLNFDKSDLNTFVKFGSAYEFLRVSIQNIILAYPGSLFVDSQKGLTYSGLTYDSITNISTFYVPIIAITNTFGLVYNNGNTSIPDDVELKNINDSYGEYVISTTSVSNTSYAIIGFTGNTVNSSDYLARNTLKIQTIGNPFAPITTGVTGAVSFHIKPNNVKFEEFRALLNPYEAYIVSERDEANGFKFTLKTPTLLDNGTIIYSNTINVWPTGDGYNIDIDTPIYQRFLQIVLTIGAKFDKIKTDLIARFLTPSSLKTYDLTEDGKVAKLLRIYGKEFDQIKEFVDSLVFINKVTYDKLNNIPDQLIKNLSKTFGWDYFSLVNENELVNSFLSIDDTERSLNVDLLPAEIDVELWRRILNNTSYFWKSKGTRETIKSMFLLIGIPEPFINITEYVYTVEGKINPNTVQVAQQDFPTNSLPYDTSGYPIAPLETNTFYFQISGDTDGGERYFDAFRMAGFNLMQTVDNKKSWVQTGATTRIHSTTPRYYQEDSRLVLNTKAVDIALDTARGIEYDVFDYIKNIDFPANNSGYTLPFSYVNISLSYTGTQNTFQLPTPYDKTQGDLEVRYNGILLNAPKTGTTSGVTTNADYDITGNSFTILNGNYAINSGNRRDVIQATFIYSGNTRPVTGVSVQYVVSRVKVNLAGTIIPLPTMPRGDVQVTINGIALTKGTPQFTADYIVDPNNTTGSSQIILQNPDVIAFLVDNPEVQVAYVQVDGSDDINARSEVIRIDSFNNSKIYFNNSANKYVYKLNYKANDASEIKLLIDGIALEPYKDYSINTMNPYEIFLPKGLRYGNVISVYYLVGGNAAFTPVVSDVFGIGDISQLSFLEFLELVQRKMINARNRKTITDFKGGWYPTILRIYEMYYNRSTLPVNDTLKSNGYTFENLYPFLSKYNAFFQRFIDQMLSATIIIKKGGLLIRNSMFTKQKFTYKRGVNLYAGITTDVRGNEMLQYLGDDGSTFQITQTLTPPAFVLHVDTKIGTAGTNGVDMGYIENTGGYNISGSTNITEYGIKYKKDVDTTWESLTTIGLCANTYRITINNLTQGATYQYAAVVCTPLLSASGCTLSLTIPTEAPVLLPSGKTKQNTSSTTSTLVGTGGYAIQCYQDINWYGMQYECIGSLAEFNVTPQTISSISSNATSCNVTIIGETTNYYTASASTAWLTPATPNPPTPSGIVQTISIGQNTGAARSGCVKYTPTVGSPKYVTLSQVSGIPPITNVITSIISCTTTSTDMFESGTITQPQVGDSYYAEISYNLCKGKTDLPVIAIGCVYVMCNDLPISGWSQRIASSKLAVTKSGSFGTIRVNHGDVLQLYTCAYSIDPSAVSAMATATLSSITNIVGSYAVGTPHSIYSEI